MEILDQEGEGQEAQIEDIKRVLSTYSHMTPEEIDHFLAINNTHHQRTKIKDILKRISGSVEREEIAELLGEKANLRASIK